jgi:hypothetical protein
MAMNDFTGTWICRGGTQVEIIDIGGGVFHGVVGGIVMNWDEQGNCAMEPSLDLMERISEKDLRR